ncbi:MAG: GGDEF domain-containing protein [Syntrophales bacterium]
MEEIPYGGEEFLILLTETAKAEALEVAEKIRAAVSVRPFPHAGTQPEGKQTRTVRRSKVTFLPLMAGFGCKIFHNKIQ